ncbi:helix-turn-helix transcriptional regulator [Actinacidiphila acidipaludis]|uniref:Helix-turn-helix transcriptional regulator n=1 Tax=Actinacidiphila acidipaludis TaxID=2873382 RepID=A0ABS7Q7Z7_9ACTN|nr:helix-turn-helix transcriptional regulator [Streptomyces acidipaludis]MBY8878956.1 helix-turn-helix transcriptional regulator [Streptomyces acidipaludis]
MARTELGRFLRARREGLRPADVGLTAAADGTPRRTPGLRREEIAELAHMSADYYTRLEQARGPRPSARILDALTDALRLTPAERDHLFRLAGTGVTPPAGPVRRVRPHVAALLDRMPGTGAVVTDAAYDVIAFNPLAEALLGSGLRAEPNMARRRFLGTGRPRANSAAEEFGRVVVSRLRRSADRYPQDAGLAALLAELRDGSAEFRRIWDTAPVHEPGHRTKVITHPELGPLTLACDVLAVPEDDQQVVLMTAEPGSPSARALATLVPRPAARS